MVDNYLRPGLSDPNAACIATFFFTKISKQNGLSNMVLPFLLNLSLT